jgi:ribonuclease HI
MAGEPRPDRAEILRIVAEVEGFEASLARLPGLSREALLRALGVPEAKVSPVQAELFAERPSSTPRGGSPARPSRGEPREPAPRRRTAPTEAAPTEAAPTAAAGIEAAILHTDGASRGNPGPASVGAVLYGPDRRVIGTVSERIGIQTNNHAEYEAVRLGLLAAARLGVRQVTVRADSQLAVRQLNGEYRVKNAKLKPLFDAVKALEVRFPGGVLYQHVPREQNTAADALANQALDR